MLLLAQALRDQAGKTLTAIVAATITRKGLLLFCMTSKVANSAMAIYLRCSSILRALISRWSWARSLSSSFCSYGSASLLDTVCKGSIVVLLSS